MLGGVACLIDRIYPPPTPTPPNVSIQELTREYISKDKAIIMATVSCKTDIENQVLPRSSGALVPGRFRAGSRARFRAGFRAGFPAGFWAGLRAGFPAGFRMHHAVSLRPQLRVPLSGS